MEKYSVTITVSNSELDALKEANGEREMFLAMNTVRGKVLKEVERIIRDRDIDIFKYYGPTGFNHYKP